MVIKYKKKTDNSYITEACFVRVIKRHSTHAHVNSHTAQGARTTVYYALLFHQQVFVFMSINKTRVQHNEANEEASHLALVALLSVSGGP